jgi:DNA-binding response OmpR family regulator
MVEPLASVLFADRDLEWSREVRADLRGRGVSVTAARSSREVLEMARRHAPDVVVLDDGLEDLGVEAMVDLLRVHSPRSRVVLIVSGEETQDRPHLHAAASLRRPAAREDLLKAVEAARNPEPEGAGRTPLVLCVDDDPAFLRGLSRLLRRHGYDVLPFDSPEGALAAVPFVRPDLLILDVRMPGMNGLDLAAEIRERNAKARVVFLSAAGSDQDIAQGFRSGATGYLVKPCDPQEVVHLAAELVGGRAGGP